MPSPFETDDSVMAPDMFRQTARPERQPAGGPAAPAPTRRASKDEIVNNRYAPRSTSVERLHPRAMTKSRGNRWTMHTQGNLGDLDEFGLDVLVGMIARMNGVVFRTLPAHINRNPGGFGLTFNKLTDSATISPTFLLPKPGDKFDRPWMLPLRNVYETRGNVPVNIAFSDWQSGGLALFDYINAIRATAIPYFFNGPHTSIVELLTTYDAPCSSNTEGSYSALPWSLLLPELTRAVESPSLVSSSS